MSIQQIEFQLINSNVHGIIARIYIPAALRGKGGSFKGQRVYDSQERETSCPISGHKRGRTIEFVAPFSEYKRLFLLYGANSNMAVNRVRTTQMMRQLELQQRVVAEVKAQAAARKQSENAATTPTTPAAPTLQTPTPLTFTPAVPTTLATVDQLKRCSSQWLSQKLRQLNIAGRSRLTTIAARAEALVGRVSVSELPEFKQ